jgi:hypothetical protein
MAGGVAQGVGPEFKPQYRRKKKIPPNKNVLIGTNIRLNSLKLSYLFLKYTFQQMLVYSQGCTTITTA